MTVHAFRRTALLIAAVIAGGVAAAAQRPVGWDDLMRFRAIEDPVIAADGTAIAFAATPDRGDGDGVVRRLEDGTVLRVPRGTEPAISRDGRWVAFAVKPPLESAEGAAKDEAKPGLALVDVTLGTTIGVERVDRFAFSRDSHWLAWLHAPAAADENATATEEGSAPEAAASPKKPKDVRGGVLVLRSLDSGTQTEIPDVTTFAFDPSCAYLAYVRHRADGSGNGVTAVVLSGPDRTELPVKVEDRLQVERLAWTETGRTLAFVAGVGDATGSEPEQHAADQARPATVWVWDGATRSLDPVPPPSVMPASWSIPVKTELSWSKDGSRLFFGWRPDARSDAAPADDPADAPFDPYDIDAIRAKAGVDVWHWNDPRIVTHQKASWEREHDRLYRAVFHRGTGDVAVLADPSMPDIEVPERGPYAMGWSSEPYLKEMTWSGRSRDLYAVRLSDGARTLVATGVRERSSLSPDGRFIAYFEDGRWLLADPASGASRDITGALDVSFADEENDEPRPAAPYGIAGWIEGDRAVLLYDRYDVWEIPTGEGSALNLTAGAGRTAGVRFRVEDLDPDRRGFPADEAMLLSAFHERGKNFGFYRAVPGHAGVVRLIDEKKKFSFVARAEDAPVLLYTRESFEEFPDLWITDPDFRTPRKMTNVNPQMAELAWGSAELVQWRSLGGVPLQGVLIKPAGYEEGVSYPLLVYFYERMSDRLYSFNQPVVNHRPSFPLYASDGYAVFLPDVVYEVGRPGLSATRCVVPGVLELVRRGIADPDRLGLHGHSWGGYETGFIITQTDIFDAAIAGAPVSNMTSAYGGIRYESGLARQFQYEQTQSRLGASLWEDPVAYWENSPLFFANRITTPLLIEFGDADGAVPWTQGIEFYLAMRRLGKDCVMLTYRGEPHHVKKYPNKLDYAMKMKEYLDHYLKGAPAPAWLAEGVPYAGR